MSDANSSAPFHALTLTGGGYRGLFTAAALSVIEQQVGRPVGQLFDIVAGTSIGGILALAIAFEVPMSKTLETIVEFGPRIFPYRPKPTSRLGWIYDYFTYRNRARYHPKPVADAVERLIPAGTLLGDALHPVLIPATNLSQGKPQVFKTPHHPLFTRDRRYLVTEVALATSAAPTMFPLASLDGQLYADGGLFANAPDLVALHESEHFLGIDVEDMCVLSVGTTMEDYSVSFATDTNFGIAAWAEEARILSVIISAQQQFVTQVMEHRLNSRFLRIDMVPSGEQSKDLGLDVATEAATKTLLALGKKAASDLIGGPLDQFLAHKPAKLPRRSS